MVIVKYGNINIKKGFQMSSKIETVIQSTGQLIVQKQCWTPPEGVYKWVPWLSSVNLCQSTFSHREPGFPLKPGSWQPS